MRVIKKRRKSRIDGWKAPKVCRLCIDKVSIIDYKNVDLLKRYVAEHGKIIPKRISGNCASHQRKVSRAIKRARVMALVPFVVD